jgi:hypothetical protein
VLTHEDVKGIQLPGIDKWVTARSGSEAAYAAVAKKFPDRCFFVSCDLNPSTKLGKAADLVQPTHRFEMSIEEQASALMADGLSFSSRDPQLNVFATFGAFLEGIAREGFEMWRYQRNLNGLNEGLNVVMHFSHVGACTGRDHFSGWSLTDQPGARLHAVPAPVLCAADAARRFSRFDAAAEFGGHIVAIPETTCRSSRNPVRKSRCGRPTNRGRRSRATTNTRMLRLPYSRLAHRRTSREMPASAPARPAFRRRA